MKNATKYNIFTIGPDQMNRTTDVKAPYAQCVRGLTLSPYSTTGARYHLSGLSHKIHCFSVTSDSQDANWRIKAAKKYTMAAMAHSLSALQWFHSLQNVG